MTEVIKKINSTLIDEPAQAMRVELDRDKLWELADSIKLQGLINPITVRPKGDRFEVVAGHRRFKACQIAGVVEISCVVRELNDDQMFEIMAAENLARQDVSPLEEAVFIARLLNRPAASISEVAQKLNRSEAWINDRLEILKYPEYMQIAIENETLKLGVAKCLGAITDDLYRKQFVDSAIKNGMSILQAKFLLSQFELGIYRPSDEIMPSNEELGGGGDYRVKAQCERCGKLAVEPNLKNVFIHYDCPNENNPTE